MIGPLSVGEIAARVRGAVVGDASRLIDGVSTPEEGDSRDLVFIGSPRHLERAAAAGAALVGVDVALPSGLTAIRVADPAQAMAQVIDWLFPPRRNVEGISPAAFIDPSASIGANVGIGPFACIGADVRIGDGTEIHPSATIGRGTTVGRDCVIHAGVHIYPEMVIGDRVILHSGAVIGADGFGYTREAMSAPPPDEPVRHRKIRQVGRAVIGDDVEIGANTTIDRATLTATRIGRGTKIDNLVTIGHNAVVGRHCIIIGQAGISGSTTLADYVTIAGQAGLAGHIHVGRHAVVGAQSGVTKDVPESGVVLGSPAVEARRAKKALTLIDSLPELKRTLAAHERRLAILESLGR
jgi:UDP-3-O-[3-hydroxymyristoyl] glucosamine N-acyltransferase